MSEKKIQQTFSSATCQPKRTLQTDIEEGLIFLQNTFSNT